MLVSLLIAQALGLGPDDPEFDFALVLSVGGLAIAVSAALADAMRAAGHGFGFDDPQAARAGGCVSACRFPFSTQTELVRYWLHGSDLAQGVSIQAVLPRGWPRRWPPERWMCFVSARLGRLTRWKRAWVPCCWRGGPRPPKRGLVLTRSFADTRPKQTGRMMRAVWRACRWLDRPDNRSTAAEILSCPECLKVPPELLGRLPIWATGEI